MKLIAILFVSITCNVLQAQFAGTIDPTFGFSNSVNGSVDGRDVKQLSNGHIIVVGSHYYNSSLTQGGLYEFDQFGNLVSQNIELFPKNFFACDTIDHDNYVAVGKSDQTSSEIVFAKTTPLLDVQFKNFYPLYQNVDVFDIVTQPDGKFVICGFATTSSTINKFWVARFNNDLTIDSTFGSFGHVTLTFGSDAQARAVALQPDGKIVAVGHSISNKQSIFVRLTVDGILDNTFYSTGYKLSTPSNYYNELYSVTVGPDYFIYAVGNRKDLVEETQLNVIQIDYSQEDFFNPGAQKWYHVSLQIDSNKLIVAGQSNPDGNGRTVPTVYRFRENDLFWYELETINQFNGFGNGGKYTTGLNSTIHQDATYGGYIQPDGKILLCGQFNGQLFVTRLDNDASGLGTSDVGSIQEISIYPNPSNGIFNLAIPTKINHVQVYDLRGNEIDSRLDNQNTLTCKAPAGIYLLKITTDQGQSTQRIQIQ